MNMITYCTTCSNLAYLLDEIDERLKEFGHNQLNNIKLALKLEYDRDVVSDLINYKRIIYSRIRNPNYLCTYPIEKIYSRVIDLLKK
jgi:hypothetical protein